MLFNSYPFLLLFLPIVLIGYAIIGRTLGRGAVFTWLVAASLFFYGWWNWFFLTLLLASLLFNYAAGTWLSNLDKRPPAKIVLGVALAFNIGFLGYFKYADFFITNINTLLGADRPLLRLVLPLGISFYTFQKIAYLVDSYQGKTRGYGFRDFCLFVSFFPQLIAGPITHHGEIMPQFRKHDTERAHWDDWSVGFTLFTFGLAKKVLLADRLATFASPVFQVARHGADFGLAEAWAGVLAYTLQLYFDFSGYSDMAIGLARLFGIRLPMNFNSPYQATNIADFWRRWHVTLSRFLRDYLYIPLGGNRRGSLRKYFNLFITMLIGGIWHGAGWTFVIWGALHGLYLTIHHAWRDRIGKPQEPPSAVKIFAARGATFLFIVVAWIFFRADGFMAAKSLLVSMTGAHGFSSNLARIRLNAAWFTIVPLLLVVWFFPNSHQLLKRFEPTLEYAQKSDDRLGVVHKWAQWLVWRPRLAWAIGITALAVGSIVGLSRITEFIYWQF
jgi:D-alanyl-lipoteichoic acid acyltransferase DltB (MBOAT superfamily)